MGTGGFAVKLPPIHRQMQREGQGELVCLFILGSGRRYKGLPLEDGCGHGHGHVGGGEHGCEEAGPGACGSCTFFVADVGTPVGVT